MVTEYHNTLILLPTKLLATVVKLLILVTATDHKQIRNTHRSLSGFVSNFKIIPLFVTALVALDQDKHHVILGDINAAIVAVKATPSRKSDGEGIVLTRGCAVGQLSLECVEGERKREREREREKCVTLW